MNVLDEIRINSMLAGESMPAGNFLLALSMLIKDADTDMLLKLIQSANHIAERLNEIADCHEQWT